MANFIVGLTGGIGSGKTTVANMFAELGVDLIDADVIARQVVSANSPALAEIAEHFGKDYLLTDGNLNRIKLRAAIFVDTEEGRNEKKWLDDLLHPLIQQELLQAINLSSSQYCLLIAPLLIENKLTEIVDRTLIIDVDQQTQISRTMDRDNNSRSLVENIINHQISRQQRLAAADDIIDNNSADLSKIQQQVINLHQKYLQLSQ